MSRFEVVETVEALAELPNDSVIQAAELDKYGHPGHNVYTYFQKYGGYNPWIEMDPGDRYDGENGASNGQVWNTAHGFGNPQEGEIRVIFNPDWEKESEDE